MGVGASGTRKGVDPDEAAARAELVTVSAAVEVPTTSSSAFLLCLCSCTLLFLPGNVFDRQGKVAIIQLVQESLRPIERNLDDSGPCEKLPVGILSTNLFDILGLAENMSPKHEAPYLGHFLLEQRGNHPHLQAGTYRSASRDSWHVQHWRQRQLIPESWCEVDLANLRRPSCHQTCSH